MNWKTIFSICLLSGLVLGFGDALVSHSSLPATMGIWSLHGLAAGTFLLTLWGLLHLILPRALVTRLKDLAATTSGFDRLWPHGVALIALGSLLAAPLAVIFSGWALVRVTDPALAQLLTGLLAVGGICFLISLFVCLALVLRLAGRRFTGLRFPLLSSAVLALSLPALAWSLFLLRHHGQVFSGLAGPLGFVQVVLAAAAGLALFPRIPSRLGVGLLVLAGLLSASTLILAAFGSAANMESAGVVTSRTLALARNLTDRDRDGASPLFGGGDCDDSSPEIRPGAQDIPGNGVDEDCDGVDAEESEVQDLPLFGDPSPLPYPSRSRFNVLVIQVEALRADRMQFLGYSRKNAPNLTALASESLVFSKCYSQSSCTRKSVPSLFTGRYPQHMDWDETQQFYGVKPSNITMAELLRQAGYQTGAIVNAWLYERVKGFSQGFDHFVSVYKKEDWKKYSNQSSPKAVFRSIEFLEHRKPDQPFLLFTYLEDPHEPYLVHGPPAFDFGKSVQDRYDSEISYTDAWIGVLLEYLKEMELWDNTVVIMFADHGEEFGEHGGKFHCSQLYNESIHVPLLIRVPGLAAKTIEQPTALVDVLPTLLDVLGIDPGKDPLQGTNLLRLEAGESRSTRPIFSFVRNAKSRGDRTHSLVLDRWHYLWKPESGQEQLFDLLEDPGEKQDRSQDKPSQMKLSRELMKAFLEHAELK